MLLLVLGALAAAFGAPAAQHPFTVHDMLAMDRISDPQPSPDAKQVVFAVSRTDLEGNRRRSDLWLVDVQSGALTHLTAPLEGNDESPRFSPDGRAVYFLSSRTGRVQLWRIRIGGGEAERVSDLPVDVNAFVLAPNGREAVLSLEVFVDCKDLACTRKRLDELGARKASGRIYDHLFVRHWDTFSDGRRSHLFALPLTGGVPVDLMKGLDGDCPSKPFGGPEEIAISGDGKKAVFAVRLAGREEAWSTNFDLYAAPLDGSSPVVRLTTNPAADTQPAFSPDGKSLAYLAQSQPGYESDRYRIRLRDWASGKERALAPGWDRSPDGIAWSHDGKRLLAVAGDVGQEPLFAIDVSSGEVRKLYGDGVIKTPAAAGDRVFFTREHLRGPAEIYTIGSDGSGFRQLTHVNDSKLAAVEMGEPSQFSFKGWNDETVYGFIVKPVRFDARRKYPVALLIHGGPQGSFQNDFHYRWNPQAYAGAGFAAVTIDFHGSTGYGQAFTDSIAGDWGGKPLEDLQKGLAAALAANPWMDGKRVCALGASFGGYMINWIAGAWPDRFRCLVSHDGNLDERAAYFDTDELWFPEHDHGGTPWTHLEGYEKQNPVNLVSRWKTPMLVIHGGKDYRVVDAQGLSSFTALQRLGIPSKLLYFPDENHWVLKPLNSILWHETVLAWLERWARAGAR
jgi:dipeptidyl aminopeptidase/acylaminoacyl peptidase